MGCDIHGIFQAKIDGEWVDVEQEELDRNYLLFGWLAGVRMDEDDGITPIARGRGIPADFEAVMSDHDEPAHPVKDISVLRGFERKEAERTGENVVWMGDHNYSWVLLSECLESEPPKYPGDRHIGIFNVNQFLDKCRELQAKYGECRFVFGFDN